MKEQVDQDAHWIVVHGVMEEGGAIQPVSVEACYRDRAPYGEYVLFAASDPEAIEEGKISIVDYAYLAEVRVTFEEDLVGEGANNIDWCFDDFAEQGDRFAKEVWPSWQDVRLIDISDSIFPPGADFVMAKSVLSVEENSATWVEVTRIEAEQPAELALTFSKVERNRLLEVKAVLKEDQLPVALVSALWEQLVARFRDLPYMQLVGAERIEPEDEDEDFVIDSIGEVAGEA
ncbi:hypothetical protein SAMN04488056_104211 [Cohaesibacter marisflavi]|uniref:Uncharacterized protein n=1 Tax=Cohaesibacter marisflavi TaxID=655353 RepID=A0A1I5FUM7_9HYPH|nr:hypothetical protein [Cohaesibacter marisflavi]SFO27306.1 hypothetical protein SAMN04488056_104211 [Cohaesibacter marisflavi]